MLHTPRCSAATEHSRLQRLSNMEILTQGSGEEAALVGISRGDYVRAATAKLLPACLLTCRLLVSLAYLGRHLKGMRPDEGMPWPQGM